MKDLKNIHVALNITDENEDPEFHFFKIDDYLIMIIIGDNYDFDFDEIIEMAKEKHSND